jgi:probable F420-dependent oxidoreductase
LPSELTYGLSLRHGVTTRADGSFDTASFAELVRYGEEVGFHHVLVPDHVFVPEYWGKVITDVWLEPFSVLSYLAAVTSRIELVIACLVVPYRQPFITAKSVATLDQLSGGRAALGIVPGYLKEEFEAFALPLEERSAMTNEFVRIMIELWTEPHASYDGTYYSFDGVGLKPPCVRTPHAPIWVGGSSRAALKRVAEFGDVWTPLGFMVVNDAYQAAHEDELAGKSLPTSGTTPEQLAADIAFVKTRAADAGRDLSHLQVVVAPNKLTTRIERLREYVDAGATGLVFNVPGETADECRTSIDSYAAEVMAVL